MSKMTGCFIKLLSQLPNIWGQHLKTNGDHKDERLEAIQTILDVMKMSRHSTQDSVSIRKNFLLFCVSSEYNDLAKFAEDTYSHRIKEGIIVCRHSSLRQTTRMFLSENSMKLQKNDRPPKRPMADHKGTPQYNFPSTLAELKKQSSRKSQYKSHKYGRN